VRDTQELPLVVDLDGTLTLTDTLAESAIRAFKNAPLNVLRAPFWLARGRSVCKAKVAERADLDVEHLPYRESLVNYLKAEKKRGRRIVLATAAHHSIAEQVAGHLDLFDEVLATRGNVNLKSEAKLESIRAHVGEHFVYAGNSNADVPIWVAAQGAILAGVTPALAKTVRKMVCIEQEFANQRVDFGIWLKAIRVHHWLKNLLLFVPLLTAFAFFDAAKLATLVVAFFSMSLGASATYITNDLWDLDSDRRHPRKRNRPFASGVLSIASGVGVATILLIVSFALALVVSPLFLLVLLLYLALTTLYSWYLKSRVLVDVIMLALLYTLRIGQGQSQSLSPSATGCGPFRALRF